EAWWMHVDRPPFSGSIELAATAADARVLPWQAYREGTAVVRLGTINVWPEVNPQSSIPNPQSALTAQACIDATDGPLRPDAPLIYPGSVAGLTEPIPSVRLKRLRRGMLDLAYLKLMREKGLGHIADVLAASLAPFAGAKAYRYHYADAQADGWVRDSRWWQEAEQIMMDELSLALRQGPVETQGRMAATMRWQRFIEATRRVRIEIEGVRAWRVAPAAQGTTRIECAVVFHNGKRTAVSGSIGFGELPVGWRNLHGPIQVVVPPNDALRLTLAAEAAVVTWNDDGVRDLPLVFTTEDGNVLRLAARMGYLAAQPLDRRLLIDGELSDWPPGVGNRASDFVLVSGEPPDRPAAEPQSITSAALSSRPSSITRVYAAADAEALYFAFDCATPGEQTSDAREDRLESLAGSHTNVVEYDDLIPVGEELAEIVLDPTGAGTHSTSDLYHIVLKPSGTLWEHGIGTEPPTGRRRVWAADIRYAAQTYPDRWVAEVRIPLEAFGADAGSGRIWRVDFSRFDLKRQEYSNWAGAVRNFYDPASLGNLALP
ncbi:MAG: hypothetical protein V2A79_02300, partial [Planctomycetota bacterium]